MLESLENIAKQDRAFGNPEKFCSDIEKSKWESATLTTSDDKIISYIEKYVKETLVQEKLLQAVL